MSLKRVVAAFLIFTGMAIAQYTVRVSPSPHPQAAPAPAAAPNFPLPGNLKLPDGLLEKFWNDPEICDELHLTAAQKKQLQDGMLAQQLALIDSGADALKALTRISVLVDAEQWDDNAYKQQLNELAAATGKVVQNLGEMAVVSRRVLTPEQWRKLQSLQRAKREAARAAARSRTAMPEAGEHH